MNDVAENGEGEASTEGASEGAAESLAPVAGRAVWLWVGGVTALVTAAVSYAFQLERAGTMPLLTSLGAVYGVLLIATLVRMGRAGTLREQLTPNRGDLTFGSMLALGGYLILTLVHSAATSQGAWGEPWAMRIYLQLGDPRVTRMMAVGLAIMVLGAAEEIVWRGGVMGALREAYGARRALWLSALLYAVAHLPTVYLLRDPAAGYNPILPLVALGAGLVWAALALRLGRLLPSVISHALFSWAVVQFPLWHF